MQPQRHQSCLVTHLGHYLDLCPAELEILQRLEASEQQFDANAIVQRRARPARNLYVIKQGWLFSSIDLVDGRRHILQIHHPGDVIGIQNVPFENATCDLTSLESCVLCPFERRALGQLMHDQPRLGALMISLSARDQVIANDLKRGTARYSANDRILLLLLMLLHRLRVTNRDIDDTIRFPVNQTHVGDVMGLTNVSVSKAMGELESEGWLSRTPSTIRLNRIDESMERLDFQDRYARIDTAWFPASREPND